MNYVNPTPGEYIDRLIILDLKIRAGILRGLRYSHWQKEEEAIRHILTQNYTLNQEKACVAGELWSQLYKANREIWILEDECRINPDLPHRLIQDANDKRYEMINALNLCYGLADLEEKVNYGGIIHESPFPKS